MQHNGCDAKMGRCGPDPADQPDPCRDTVRAALFGAAWAAIPAFLQAKRGSHIVITTIMFNFIAAALLNYLLIGLLKPTGSMEPATGKFPEATHLPSFQDMFSFGETALFRGWLA